MTDEEREQIATEIIEKLEQAINNYLGDADRDQIKPSKWSACLMYTGKQVFNPLYKDILKDKDKPTVYGLYIYNYRLIMYICDFYIYKCRELNQIISCNGFSYLINLDTSLLEKWADQTSEEASPEARQIIQKLNREKESSLCDVGLYGSGKNPVGFIAALNHYYRWNDAPGASAPQNDAKSIENLPDFSQFRQIAQHENGNN